MYVDVYVCVRVCVGTGTSLSRGLDGSGQDRQTGASLLYRLDSSSSSSSSSFLYTVLFRTREEVEQTRVDDRNWHWPPVGSSPGSHL